MSDELVTNNASSNGARAKISASLKQQWSDPAIREKRISALNTATCVERMSASAKAYFADPSNRATRSAAQKAKWQDPNYRAKMIDVHKAKWRDAGYRDKMIARLNEPLYRARASKTSKHQWSDVMTRAKMMAALSDPDYLAKMRARLRTQWHDPEYRSATMTGRALSYLPKAVRDKLSDDDVAILSLPEVRAELIATMSATTGESL